MNSMNINFSFDRQELPIKIRECLSKDVNGYWQISFDQKNDTRLPDSWFVGMAQGRVIFTGEERMQWLSLTQALQKFIKPLRGSAGQQHIHHLLTEIPENQIGCLGKLLIQLESRNSFTHNDAIAALRLHILLELERYLFNTSGKAVFIPDPDLLVNAPIRGFEWNILLLDLTKRQQEWAALQSTGFSSTSSLTLDAESLDRSDLPNQQKDQLRALIGAGKRLEEISSLMAKDPLDVALNLSRLAKKGLILVKSEDHSIALPRNATEIFIVDDSPVLVKQFHSLLTRWGYQVISSNDALRAVEAMQQSNPAVIFLDINMPGASGFELIKQIRRVPKLSGIPIVLLTAEKTVSNQFRAQWASCKFLSKPLTSDAVSGFKTELFNLLKELICINAEAVA